MADRAWKALERKAAQLFGTARFKANTGGEVDFESPDVLGQVKLRKTLSLETLTQLVEQIDRAALLKGKLGVVCAKVRRGRGQASPILVVMTSTMFQDWFDFRDRGESDVGKEPSN